MRAHATKMGGNVAPTSLEVRLARMFAAGEQGAWYDPSDFSTMFQDSAGTTPVTAVEQPVGKILDKSGRGNHATQVTSTARPVLSSRINLITKSEQFDDVAWTKGNGGTGSVPVVTANFAVAPDGTTTADRVQLAMNGGTTSSDNSSMLGPSITGSVGGSYTASVWARTNDGTTKNVAFIGVGGLITVCSVTPSWQRFSVTGVAVSTSISTFRFRLRGTEGSSDSADLLMWGAQFETSPTMGTYQWVDTATSYNTVGFLPYLKFDGVDDSLVTASIDFTGTDKSMSCVGVRTLNGAADGTILELASSNAVNGMFYMRSPGSGATTKFEFLSRGTSQAVPFTSGAAYIAPYLTVASGLADIAAPNAVLRLNGAQIHALTGTQGTGNYSNNPLNIGRRNSTSAPFNGNLYGLIILGRLPTSDELFRAERYMGQKTGVVL